MVADHYLDAVAGETKHGDGFASRQARALAQQDSRAPDIRAFLHHVRCPAKKQAHRASSYVATLRRRPDQPEDCGGSVVSLLRIAKNPLVDFIANTDVQLRGGTGGQLQGRPHGTMAVDHGQASGHGVFRDRADRAVLVDEYHVQ